MALYERTEKRSGLWTAGSIAFGLLIAIAAAEFFVTHCAFSSNCPATEKIADWPLSKLVPPSS